MPEAFKQALAEREGFEPSIRLRVFRFSRPAYSTTLAPLRNNKSYYSSSLRRLQCVLDGSLRMVLPPLYPSLWYISVFGVNQFYLRQPKIASALSSLAPKGRSRCPKRRPPLLAMSRPTTPTTRP